MINIGIVGTGDTVSIGHYHELGIRNDERAVLSGVYNRSVERSKKFIAERGLDAKACESYEELLAISDGVVICTPNDSHYDYAKRAIERGISVLLEKPLSNDLEEAKNLFELKLKEGQIGVTGFIYRYSNLFNEMKMLVSSELGRIYTFSCNYGGKRLCNETLPIEWRMLEKQGGSGAIGDYVSHVIDLAYYIAGIKIVDAKAFSNIFIKDRPVGTDGKHIVENPDSAVISGIGEKGELFSVCTSRLGMEDMRICITGVGGMVIASDMDPTHIYLYKRNFGEGLKLVPQIIEVKSQEVFSERFLLQMRDFISAIKGEYDGYANFEQGLYVQEVLDKIERSCKE